MGDLLNTKLCQYFNYLFTSQSLRINKNKKIVRDLTGKLKYNWIFMSSNNKLSTKIGNKN